MATPTNPQSVLNIQKFFHFYFNDKLTSSIGYYFDKDNNLVCGYSIIHKQDMDSSSKSISRQLIKQYLYDSDTSHTFTITNDQFIELYSEIAKYEINSIKKMNSYERQTLGVTTLANIFVSSEFDNMFDSVINELFDSGNIRNNHHVTRNIITLFLLKESEYFKENSVKLKILLNHILNSNPTLLFCEDPYNSFNSLIESYLNN